MVEELTFIALGTRYKRTPHAKAVIGPPYDIFAVSDDINGLASPPYYEVVGVENARLKLRQLPESEINYDRVCKWVESYRSVTVRDNEGVMRTKVVGLHSLLTNKSRPSAVVSREEVIRMLSG